MGENGRFSVNYGINNTAKCAFNRLPQSLRLYDICLFDIFPIPQHLHFTGKFKYGTFKRASVTEVKMTRKCKCCGRAKNQIIYVF